MKRLILGYVEWMRPHSPKTVKVVFGRE